MNKSFSLNILGISIDMTIISTIMFIPKIFLFLELSLIFIIVNLFDKKFDDL